MLCCICLDKGKKEKTLKSGKDEGSDDNKNKSHDKEELSNIVDAKESWQSGNYIVHACFSS